ncbi:hypothetical protein CCP3SC1_1480001 [Gammaproteobacteria bacterium]
MVATSELVFWGLISLMTLGAVLVSILPWIRPRPSSSENWENLNVVVYRDRLTELEMAMDYPALTFDQREQERRELTQELLDDVDASNLSQPSILAQPAGTSSETDANVNSGRWALFVIATGLPITALLLYALLGTGIHGFSATESGVTNEKMVAITQMVAKLADRLAANPNDLRGWTMLGRSYMALERYSEAAKAYAQANTLATDKDNMGLAIDYAEALLLANGNQMSVQVQTLVTKVLQEVPEHPKGLWLAGVGAFQEEHYQAAAEFWKRLRALLPEDSDILERINSAIVEAEQRAATNASVAIPDNSSFGMHSQIPAQSAAP